MKKYALLLLLVAFGFYSACYVTILNTPSIVFKGEIPVKVTKVSTTEVDRIFMSTDYGGREAELLQFLRDHFITGNGGVRTSLKAGADSEKVLSESLGLLMNYSAARGRKDLFDSAYKYMKEQLVVNGRYIRWRSGDTSCNAAIDDLRILRALLDAGEAWGVKDYYDTAGFIQDGLFARQVSSANLMELYDWKLNRARNLIPLCYLDMYTMDRLRVFNESWTAAADSAVSAIKKGFIGDSPLLYKYYDYGKGSYVKDEEASKGKGVCLTYTLYSMIHLLEMNEDTARFTDWLKKELKDKRLYGWYDPQTLKPSQKIESTAVYALAAVYAKKAGEQELFDSLLESMLGFRVEDRKSDYYGGFGNPKTHEFFSFDNLTALWALSLAD